jgi:hypothetical protein
MSILFSEEAATAASGCLDDAEGGEEMSRNIERKG